LKVCCHGNSTNSNYFAGGRTRPWCRRSSARHHKMSL